MANLNFYYSVMSSGKSTLCLQLNYSLSQKGFKPLLLKSNIDTRDKNVIKSRIGLSQKCFSITSEDIEQQHYDKILTSTHILVDEAQFLSRENVMSLSRIADFRNIEVFCFGLRTDYTGNLFEGSKHLFALSDNLIEVPTISADGNKQILHIKYTNNVPVFNGESIEVGDMDKYSSVSRKEWLLEYYKNKNPEVTKNE